MNIVEDLDIKKEYFVLAQSLSEKILKRKDLSLPKMIIGIAGESGSGKSTTAFCLESEFKKEGYKIAILHMDSYFKLPPKENHNQRIKSLDHVGPQEVDFNKMNAHLLSFVNKEQSIQIPIVNYKENHFNTEELQLADVEILIIEGVYTFLLENLDVKIFLKRSYLDTFEARSKRTREEYDPIVETILEIEHKIVSPMIEDADHIINKDYQIQ